MIAAPLQSTAGTVFSPLPALRPARRRGLSLIEVLLAMAIFLISLVAVARLVDMGAEREMESRFQSRGTRLALTKLAEVECGAQPLENANGTFDGEDADWSWTLTVQDYGITHLYHVTVTVTRDIKGQPFSVTLSQLILDPTVWGAAGEATRPDPSATGSMGETQ